MQVYGVALLASMLHCNCDREASHLVVHILDKPKCDSLHRIALPLQLCQQVYVGCTCGVQGPAYVEAPLPQLLLWGQQV